MFNLTEDTIRSGLGLLVYNTPEDTENKLRSGMSVHMHAHTHKVQASFFLARVVGLAKAYTLLATLPLLSGCTD